MNTNDIFKSILFCQKSQNEPFVGKKHFFVEKYEPFGYSIFMFATFSNKPLKIKYLTHIS